MEAKPKTIQVPPNCDLTLGLVCVEKAEQGRTKWKMFADERFCNPAGIIQGGFLAALADSAMGATSVTWAKGKKVYSSNVEFKISFFRPVMPGIDLYCTAQVISGGRRCAFIEASITDSKDTLFAKASSTFLYTPR
ncbi:MAG: PaaI family thioesterase [Actinobacteria bacterium]|jgi:uncharacterized protein (TIGR00369 family)|nr:PaaI family thioesterase [Actinomycetota bacterium]MCL6105720.1 PaaI family thioesterase [Actinomycetota bacterium]